MTRMVCPGCRGSYLSGWRFSHHRLGYGVMCGLESDDLVAVVADRIRLSGESQFERETSPAELRLLELFGLVPLHGFTRVERHYAGNGLSMITRVIGGHEAPRP